MVLIDSHCHLEFFHKKGNLDQTLDNAQSEGINQIITIGTCASDWALYKDMAHSNEGNIYYTAGLHPSHVEEDWEEQLLLLNPYFSADSSPVALGEIGLDYFHLPKNPDEAAGVKYRQGEAFRRQLSLALEVDCPVVIHSRNAFNACLEVIDKSGIDFQKVVFHCFAHGPEEMKLLMKKGGRGSFTGIITYKSADSIRQAAQIQGLDQLMIETDAPYLAPVPRRGKRNEPAYLVHTARFCAQFFELDPQEFAQRASENTRNFFHLNH